MRVSCYHVPSTESFDLLGLKILLQRHETCILELTYKRRALLLLLLCFYKARLIYIENENQALKHTGNFKIFW